MAVIRVINGESMTGKWMRARHFTDRAAYLVCQMSDRILDRGMTGVINPGIIFWTMLRWERLHATELVKSCGAELHSLERDLDEFLARTVPPERQRDAAGDFIVDLAEIDKIVQQATIEANSLGKDYVASEHLVLSLLRSSDERLARIFARHGLTHERYRDTLAHA